ncbi:hypothetical protein [Streptomyces sp. NPDC088785]|uniref:hypothetical protein n=1 Tax=Streptomyces sp. NPDC088785 TaxID=3365897 RepID=UPI0037F5703C
MFATPTGAIALVVCALLAGWAPPGRGAGHALEGGGAQPTTEVGFTHARIGQTWYYALPLPTNRSGHSIRITRARIVDPPQGMKITGFGAYAMADVDAIPLLAPEGDPDTPDFDRLKNHATAPVTVPAGQTSDFFFEAVIELVSPPRGAVRRCEYEYEYAAGGRRDTQVLPCGMVLKVAEPRH